MEKKIKNLRDELNNILLKTNTKVDKIKSSTNRAIGGIKRQTKGILVEKIYSKIIRFCLKETKSKYKLINKIGNLPKNTKKIPKLKVSNKYINIKNLNFSKNEELNGYEDRFDGFIIDENNKIKMIIEYKAYSELTMLKRCLVDAMIAQNFDNEIKYCLCLLQSQISSQKRLVGYSAHSLLDYFYTNYDIDADILILVQEPRRVNEDIIKKNYKINFELLEKTVEYFLNFLKKQSLKVK